MPWSYDEDILLLESDETALHLAKKIKRKTPHEIRLRRNKLKDTTIEKLKFERSFILENYFTLEVKDIAKCLKLTSNMVSRRIHSLKRDGEILVDKPKKIDTKESKEITESIVYNVKFNSIEPMEKVMVVPYEKAPEEALNKEKIQEDLLEVGKYYRISNVGLVREKHRAEYDKVKMRLIGCYPNHYLFQDNIGIKHSFSKIDYYLGEWKAEEA